MLTVVNFAEGFSTERYIFPVGYEAIRCVRVLLLSSELVILIMAILPFSRYPSMVNKTADAEYVCRIVDSGQGGPRFELHPSDQPGTVIHAQTPTGAWSQVVRAANKLRERNHSNSVSGPDYYGLSHNLVKALIQELPGASSVPGYAMQVFVEEQVVDKGKKGKKSGRRKSRVGDESMDQSNYGIEVDDGTYDTSGYGNGGGGDQYGREGSYDSGSYPASASPEATSAYDAQDYTNPASLANLLQGGGQAQPADPYAIPQFNQVDPYAIPTAQPAFDPSFGGAYGAAPAFNPYDLPGGQSYASSDSSSP